MKLCWIVILALTLLSCQTPASQHSDVSELSASASSHDPLDLNQFKTKIRRGMAKLDVVSLLGSPQWASIPGDTGDFRVRDKDTGLILYWRNPGLGIIEVHFDKDMKVRFDEGNPNDPVSYSFMFEPPKEFECNQADRKMWCQ